MNEAPPQAWVDTLADWERAAYDSVIEQGYSHEQAYDAIIRAREELAELVAAQPPKPGAPGRRKRRAKGKAARASRKRNRR